VGTSDIAVGTSGASGPVPGGGTRSFTKGEQTIQRLLSSPAAGMNPIEFMGGKSDYSTAAIEELRGTENLLTGEGHVDFLSFLKDKINIALDAGVDSIFVGKQGSGRQYDISEISRARGDDESDVRLGGTGDLTNVGKADQIADVLAARIILEQASYYSDSKISDEEINQGMKGMTAAEKDTMKKLKAAIRDQTKQLLASQDIRELADALGTTSAVVRESIRDKGGAGFATLQTLYSGLADDKKAGVLPLLNQVGGRDLSMIGGAITFDPMDTVVMATKRGGSMREGGGGGGIFNFNFTGVDEMKVFAIIRRALAQAGIRGGGNAR